MEWLEAQSRKAANPRTYALLGVLALALVWAVTEKSAPRRRAPAPAAAAALAVPLSVSSVEPTPAGWGRDPFDPRAVPADLNPKGR